jgi:hypothetical protein
MGIFNKEAQSVEKINKNLAKIKVLTNLIDGLPIPSSNTANVEIVASNDEITIREVRLKFKNNEVLNTYRIKMERVLDIIVADKTEIQNVNKSVVGRGVAGGLIFGPVGLLLGGMSGIGSKQKEVKTGKMLVISYLNKDNEVANVTLRADQAMVTSVALKFAKEVKKLLKDNNINNPMIGNDIEL